MGEHYEPEDIEEFREGGRWAGGNEHLGEHKMMTPPAKSGPAPASSAPVTTTKDAPASPTADLGGGKHEAPSS